MTFDAYYLPPRARALQAPASAVLERGDVRVLAPRLTPADVRRICDQLIDARAALVRLPAARITAAIDSAARRLRDPNDPEYDELIRGIAAFTGYSHEMATHVLERMSADWLAVSLERLVRAEFGSAAALDGFTERAHGARSYAVSPPLTFHVFAGNVPGVSVTSIVRALLVKSAVLGKTAAGEPLLAARFARLLADADDVVGACVAITYWSGGDVALESAALERADTVVHYGGASAIASLRARAPTDVHFIEHGPRISFALVSGDIIDTDAGNHAARDLARAVALFDQQGCVSPQIAYVLGDAAAARRFAAMVAAALDQVQRELPRGRLDAAEATAVRELRTRAEFRAIRGEPVELWSGQSLAWTVVLEPDPDFAGTCLNRTLLVKHAPSVHDVLARLLPFARLLQTIGVAGFDKAQLTDIAAAAADAGATRITTLADMPWPPVTWRHDGRGPLTELVRWADLEA